MTRSIQTAIETTGEHSRQMVSVATESNASIQENIKVMESLKAQSAQIASTNDEVAADWMEDRQKMMTILQEEAELNEIVQMVGMDALSPTDRLKMEAARSIREDFLHQNSFHEIDTYTPLRKQYLMMKLVLAFYEKSVDALNKGADMNTLIAMPVREKIGRYKYTTDADIESEYKNVEEELDKEVAAAFGKEDF